MRRSIHEIPVQICGLALAMASLDTMMFRWYGHSYGVFAVISILLLALFTLRVSIDRNSVLDDIKSPAVFGILPTYGMAVMVLSARFSQYSDVLSVIWSAAVILNIIIMIIFVKRFVPDLKITDVYPAWFVVFVGSAVASVSCTALGMIVVGQMLLWFDIACYMILLPVITYRVIKFPVPSAAIPGIAIFAAPANLCIAGYFAVYQPISEIIMILGVLGIVSYVAVMIYMPKILRTKFTPTLSAITFPLVISAVSFHLLADHYGISENAYVHLALVLTAMIAAAAVCYVMLRYIVFFRDGIKIEKM